MNICNRRNLPTLLVGCLMGLVPVTGYGGETLGAAMCERAVPGESCSTAWDFTATPRKFYWVERFEYESNAVGWKSVAGPFAGDSGVTDEQAEGGFLYRVVGCNDKLQSNACIGSTVFWAPSRPKDLDTIPDRIDTPGGYYLRDKRHSAAYQVLDYNSALMAKLVNTVDTLSMPAMTDLPFRDLLDLPAGISQEDAELDYNIYWRYPPNSRK